MATIQEDISIDDFINNYNTSTAFTKNPFNIEPQPEQTKTPKSYEEIPDGWLEGLKDARNQDISKLNLTKEQLINLRVDSTTIMSDEQKLILNPIIKKMKSPGLGIDELHGTGITGKNIRIAMLDSRLSYNGEFSKQIVHYENLTGEESADSFHGNALASIAVGKDCGVAPDAQLVYYAVNSCKTYTQAINKIIEQNRQLKSEGKSPISVISISCGFDLLDDYEQNYQALRTAIDNAESEGIAVITCDMNRDNKNRYPVGTNPQSDINSSSNYRIWKVLRRDDWYSDVVPRNEKEKTLLIPGEFRTVAGQFNDYRYEGADGGESWTVPYLAGCFALAKQVNPNIEYGEFYATALETADDCYNYDDNNYIGRIINPQRLISTIQKNKIGF
ncbi:S8 family serine peptidase [bacterium]|nr:S8 family serine peptidase [bacterium]